MASTFSRIRKLVAAGDVRISDHGYDELAADGVLAGEVLAGVNTATVVEDYPEYPKGPCVLVLMKDGEGRAIHAVWGIPKDQAAPAVLVTAYRPDPAKWSDGFERRRP
jgi:hypothetical protein